MTSQAPTPNIKTLLQKQRDFFCTEQTKPIAFRQEQLTKLRQAIIEKKERVVQATNADLGRSAFEAYFEISTLGEIDVQSRKVLIKYFFQSENI